MPARLKAAGYVLVVATNQPDSVAARKPQAASIAIHAKAS